MPITFKKFVPDEEQQKVLDQIKLEKTGALPTTAVPAAAETPSLAKPNLVDPSETEQALAGAKKLEASTATPADSVKPVKEGGIKGILAGFISPEQASANYFGGISDVRRSRLANEQYEKQLTTAKRINDPWGASDALSKDLARKYNANAGIDYGKLATTGAAATTARNIEERTAAELDTEKNLAQTGFATPRRFLAQSELERQRVESSTGLTTAQMNERTAKGLVSGTYPEDKAAQILAETQAATEKSLADKSTARPVAAATIAQADLAKQDAEQQAVLSKLSPQEMEQAKADAKKLQDTLAKAKVDKSAADSVVYAAKMGVLAKILGPEGTVDEASYMRLGPYEKRIADLALEVLKVPGMRELYEYSLGGGGGWGQSTANWATPGNPITPAQPVATPQQDLLEQIRQQIRQGKS